MKCYSSVQERISKLEDTLHKFTQASLSNQKNIGASIRSLETQVRQIAKQLVEQHSGKFSANIQTNPKEHCKSITTRSGIIVKEEIGNNLVVDEERKDEERKNKEDKKECEADKEKNKKIEEKSE